MKNILVLDNYDSFTFNLVHIIRELGWEDRMEVHRNDKIDLHKVGQYDKILLSPGPGIPDEAGIMKQLIQEYASEKHILGICLGHQGIAEVFGAKLFNMEVVLHGIATPTKILTLQDPLFQNIPPEFTVARYHSWSVDRHSLNGQLELTAVDETGRVMGIKHKQYSVYGLQFHPESIITEHGIAIMENWLKL